MYWRMDNLSVATSPHCHAKMISPSPVTSIAHSERGLASWSSFLFIVEFWLNWFCASLMSSWVSVWHVMSSRQCFVQFILSFWHLNSFCPFFHDVLWILEERVILMSHLGLVTCIRSFSVLLLCQLWVFALTVAHKNKHLWPRMRAAEIFPNYFASHHCLNFFLSF